jgi:hypothetical protein
MLRILAVILLAMVSFPVKPYWKESGYISSCAGRGCLGRKSECAIYSFPASEGGRNTFYCYLD